MLGLLDIGSWFLTLTTLEMFYVVSAGVGSLIFVVRVILLFFIGDGDAGLGGGIDADASFQLLSIQGLSSFFIMFGLVGIALIRSDMTEFVSVVGAFVAGSATIVVVALLSSLMHQLQSSGNIDITSAVATEGKVYLTIPDQGAGRAQIRIQNRLRTYDAMSKHHVTLETGTRIKVVEVSGDTLIVEAL